MVKVMVELYGYDGQLGFWKEYNQVNGRKYHGDKTFWVEDVAPVTPEDLDGCPDMTALADGLLTLHEGFLGQLAVDQSESGKVLSLLDKLTA